MLHALEAACIYFYLEHAFHTRRSASELALPLCSGWLRNLSLGARTWGIPEVLTRWYCYPSDFRFSPPLVRQCIVEHFGGLQTRGIGVSPSAQVPLAGPLDIYKVHAKLTEKLMTG